MGGCMRERGIGLGTGRPGGRGENVARRRRHRCGTLSRNVALTFASLAHMRDQFRRMANSGRLHFGIGCNSSGVVMAGYLGH